MDKNIFPGWEIVEELGAGAFSTVYKIRKADGFGADYFSALKVISIPNSKDEYNQYRDEGYTEEEISKLFEQQTQSVTNEFKVLSAFKGAPNIVSFEDYRVQQKANGIGWDVLIRMELLTALPNAYKAHPLTVEDTVKLGTDITGALILCEQKGVIHRDIKPQNIFVSEFGDYKLGDFGIARNMDHTTRATKIGTPAYMAPEVFHGNAYNNTADIYSLGMVLYWLLNERRMPFLPLPPQMPTAEQTSNAHTKRLSGAPLPPPKNGTDALKQVVLKACAFDPKQRFATAKEFKAALAASLAAPVVHTAPPAPTAQDIEATVAVRKAPKAQKQSNNKQQIDSQQQGSNKQQSSNGQQSHTKQQGYGKQPKSQPQAVSLWTAEQYHQSQQPQAPVKNKSKLKIAMLLEFLVIIGLSALFFFLPPTSGVTEDGRWWKLRGDTLTVSGKGELDDWDISYGLLKPEYFWDTELVFYNPYIDFNYVVADGFSSIGSRSNALRDSLTSVTIGSSVTSIGDNAFRGCDSLTSITIPDSVTSIGDYAFEYCTSLTSITIPDSVTSVGGCAFSGCTSLTSITIGDGVTSIGNWAFRNCDSLTSVTIPNSVTSIGDRAFFDCDSLTSITIPDSVTSIGDLAFRDCKALTSVNYKGTKAHWAKVSLGSDWKSYAPFTMVHCTDGDVAV